MPGKIVIKGARVHNLKNIDLEIPRDKLVVLTGVSGSGKSSLAFDTLYAEGQRRYVESLSAYARQFLEQLERPDVDSIEGLSPAISIEQKSAIRNPRSTVGTVTEVYDYLRLLFARIGNPYCFQCGREISAQTIQQVVDRLLSLPNETRIHILAPITLTRKDDYRKELSTLGRAGFVRVKIDGEIYELAEEIALEREPPHSIDLVVDRVIIRKGIEKRLADSLEIASRYGNELIKVETQHKGAADSLLFNQRIACARCDVPYPEISPCLFSFNNPHGACPRCGGLGSEKHSRPVDKDLQRLIDAPPCPECKGSRLKKESLHVKIGGTNIAEICSLPIKETLDFLTAHKLSPQERTIAQQVLEEIINRLRFIVQVGLEYLSLDRASNTLSGGEAQRIRLATQIGSSLAGVIYILDEPTVGLHSRDTARLLTILKALRDLGNTVLVVEHDRGTILEADHIIDMGPGAGVDGGEVLAQGTPKEIVENVRSLTGHYLSGRKVFDIPPYRRKGTGETLVIKGARQNNLKGETVDIPIGAMTCVTGVSGSGKSSLVVDTLYKAMARLIYRSKERAGLFDKILGWQHFNRVMNIDQTPIGRTPRSNPATYTELFNHIRDHFSQLPEARVRGYQAKRFSFNMKGGRCEACAGDGIIRIEMHFLPDAFVTCEVCHGRRYNRETLDVLYKGMSIADVLDMTVSQAIEFIGSVPSIRQKLDTLMAVGLGYIRLGQPATTLSGGEAQRVKLARELSKGSSGRTLYIFDEPTTGLHFDEIRKLLDVLNRLIEAGNTVVTIEHNLDVIKSADYIIDLGPEGGDLGGDVIAKGTPEEVALIGRSYTGQFLNSTLNR
jgi:excinuclease ABC subunit A